MKRFTDAFIVISGGGSGIGRACAKKIAAEGGRLGLIGRNRESLEATIGQLDGDGHMFAEADCGDEKAVKEAIAHFRQTADRFDGAVLSAGQHELRPLAVANGAHFQELFQGNVVTAVNVARAFAKAARREGSSLVLVSSAAAIRGGSGAGAYSAAKAALLGLGSVLARELAGKKVLNPTPLSRPATIMGYRSNILNGCYSEPNCAECPQR